VYIWAASGHTYGRLGSEFGECVISSLRKTSNASKPEEEEAKVRQWAVVPHKTPSQLNRMIPSDLSTDNVHK